MMRLSFLVWHLDPSMYVIWNRHGQLGSLGILPILWLDGHATTETGMYHNPSGTVPMDLVNYPYRYYWYYSPTER